DDREMSSRTAASAWARGDQVRHRPLCSNKSVSARATGLRLKTRQRFFGESFAALDHGFFVFGSANTHPNENVILQNVKRAAHAVRSPIGGIADAIHFFRRRSFFFILLA